MNGIILFFWKKERICSVIISMIMGFTIIFDISIMIPDILYSEKKAQINHIANYVPLKVICY